MKGSVLWLRGAASAEVRALQHVSTVRYTTQTDICVVPLLALTSGQVKPSVPIKGPMLFCCLLLCWILHFQSFLLTSLPSPQRADVIHIFIFIGDTVYLIEQNEINTRIVR